MRNYLIPLFAAAVLGVSACTDSTATGSGTGKLTVQLTDAPFPFGSVSRVDVFVVRIDAKNAATTDADAADPARDVRLDDDRIAQTVRSTCSTCGAASSRTSARRHSRPGRTTAFA